MAGLGVVIWLVLPGLVCSHGRLIHPPSRSSMWRFGYKSPHNYNDNELYCGGFSRQWKNNGGKCGICGDPYDGAREHEAGGKYATGIIVGEYTQGGTMKTTADITANHQGWMEYRLCPNNDVKRPASQECLDRYLLRQTNGSTRYYVGSTSGPIDVYLKLPPGVTCSQCVLQWKYHAGNSWGNEGGRGCVGCGPQEEFYGCADISISKGGHHADHYNDHYVLPAPTRPPPQYTPPYEDTESREVANHNENTNKPHIQRQSYQQEYRDKHYDERKQQEHHDGNHANDNGNLGYDGGNHVVDNGNQGYDDGNHANDNGNLGYDGGNHVVDNGNQGYDEDNHVSDNGNQGYDDGYHTGDRGDQGYNDNYYVSREGHSGCKFRAAGPWRGQVSMDKWCATNCGAGYCPPSHCEQCTEATRWEDGPGAGRRMADPSRKADLDMTGQEGTPTTPEPRYDVTEAAGRCRAVGFWAGNKQFDTWCNENCAQGKCPATHCLCDKSVYDNRLWIPEGGSTSPTWTIEEDSPRQYESTPYAPTSDLLFNDIHSKTQKPSTDLYTSTRGQDIHGKKAQPSCTSHFIGHGRFTDDMFINTFCDLTCKSNPQHCPLDVCRCAEKAQHFTYKANPESGLGNNYQFDLFCHTMCTSEWCPPEYCIRVPGN